LASVSTWVALAGILLREKRRAEAIGLVVEAWEASLKHRALLEATQVAPALMALLSSSQREEEAQEVGARFAALIASYPEDHPVRVALVKQLSE
jgi:urease accessory protein UreF